MVNIWLFSSFQSCAPEHFPSKFKMLLFFIWHIPLKLFIMKCRLLNASTEGYTKTVINRLDFYSVSPFKHAVKSDVSAPQYVMLLGLDITSKN